MSTGKTDNKAVSLFPEKQSLTWLEKITLILIPVWIFDVHLVGNIANVKSYFNLEKLE